MEIKSIIESVITKLCVASLTLLGFSCSDIDDASVMYGTPFGSFEVKGTVTDEDNVPVPDAVIKVTHSRVPSGLYNMSATVTDAIGEYILANSDSYCDSLKVVCIPVSNTYMPDSITVPVHYKNKKPDLWYLGHADMTVDFKLKNR